MTEWVATPQRVLDRVSLSYNEFKDTAEEAAKDRDAFWAKAACDELVWTKNFTKIRDGDFNAPVKIEWFSDGQLNVSTNCLDRHLQTRGNQTALIEVGDTENSERKLTYAELHAQVCRWANVLRDQGVKKGDRVMLYLPMILEGAIAMLACARIGAVHSAVFAGFSSQALAARTQDCEAKLIITANAFQRGGKTVPLKANVDQALLDCPNVTKVLVVRRMADASQMKEGRDVYIEELVEKALPDCAPETMNAEDPLFILYTSGSTGKPKGVLHTTAGYLLYAKLTHKIYFDVQENDVYFCTADIGWVTGHSYVVYGPLANGTTSIMFEGIPNYPQADRYWKIIDQYKVTVFYTAPTAIRALMRLGDEFLQTTTRESLRIMGSVGEPINPEAWKWYFEKIGKSRATIVDTWWQTETGGHMMAPPPSLPKMIPGSAMLPFWGIEPVLVDATNQIITGAGEGGLFIKYPWPGMARSLYKNHDRFIETYFSQMTGMYCTGDGAVRDENGYVQITGRIDDVINVSGHRFGTAEIESALVAHKAVAEAAVVGRNHDIKGTGIYAYVTLKDGVAPTDELKKELNAHVRSTIGAIASLDWLQWAPGLPKTRSGKIMRRILRKIALNETNELGDTSTLADPGVVDDLIKNRAA